MIIKCKVCDGTGQFQQPPLLALGTSRGINNICPACNGAGELDFRIPSNKQTRCKYCHGKGTVPSTNPLYINFGTQDICPACKGIGRIERPVIRITRKAINEINIPQTPRLSRYEYDIAISYAGEDRKIVERYCNTISPRDKRLKIFYDKWEQDDLWGSNLYDKLDEIYRTKALCCVIFISKRYADKVWTNHERKAAQARALQENREYILPIRLDDTELPGMSPTISYLDVRKTPITQIALITIKKVNKLKSKDN